MSLINKLAMYGIYELFTSDKPNLDIKYTFFSLYVIRIHCDSETLTFQTLNFNIYNCLVLTIFALE